MRTHFPWYNCGPIYNCTWAGVQTASWCGNHRVKYYWDIAGSHLCSRTLSVIPFDTFHGLCFAPFSSNGWVVPSSAAHLDGFLSDGSPTMWVLRYAPQGRLAVTVMPGVALHVAKSLWLQYSRALSSKTFHNASILMVPSQRMFCHYRSQPNSLAQRIMSSKKHARKKRKCWEGQRGSRTAFWTCYLWL